jgi:predicted PurR-regulated permease PerM
MVPTARDRVPVRTIAATIAMVLGTVLLVLAVRAVARVITWVSIAAFLAVLASAVVRLVEHRLHIRRGLATALVFVLGTIAVAGLGYLFVRPIVSEATQFANDFPRYVEQARNGTGPVGRLVERFNLDQFVANNADRLRGATSGLGTTAVHALSTVANTVVGLVAILVLTILMTIEGPALVRSALDVLPEDRRERVRRVAADCGHAVTGYMTGALLIATICGVSTFVVLLIMGVPFRGTVALFVALSDLIPLVGATIGAVVAVGVAFLHSVTAGIVVLAWFIVYQQLENHLLQPVIQSRTVKLNPLTVLVAVLLGVELAGILGALLAIPVAGMVSVIVRDVWDHRRGRPKFEPTVGEERRIAVGAPPQPEMPRSR